MQLHHILDCLLENFLGLFDEGEERPQMLTSDHRPRTGGHIWKRRRGRGWQKNTRNLDSRLLITHQAGWVDEVEENISSVFEEIT